METKTLKVEKRVTLLETMDEKTLVKTFTFEPVADAASALKFLNNSQERLLAVINKGLEAELEKQARDNSTGWHTYKLDAEGEETEEINGEFAGEILDPKKISNMVLTFAKMFGYSTIKDREKRRKIKDDAAQKVKKILQSDPEMRKQASLEGDSEEITEAPAV